MPAIPENQDRSPDPLDRIFPALIWLIAVGALFIGERGVHLSLKHAVIMAGAGLLLFMLDLWSRQVDRENLRVLARVLVISSSLTALYWLLHWVEDWHHPGENVFPPLFSGLLTITMALIWWAIYLGDTHRAHWAKGGCLSLVALGFAVSGTWLFAKNLAANRAEHLPPFSWNSDFGLFWALIGGGFAVAAYRAFKRLDTDHAPAAEQPSGWVERRIIPFRWSGLFIFLIAVWALMCVGLMTLMASDLRARDMPADKSVWVVIPLFAVFSLLGPGFLAFVLITQWKGRHNAPATLEWTLLSPVTVDGILRGSLRITECPRSLSHIHLGIRRALADSLPRRRASPEVLQSVAVYPAQKPDGRWQCEAAIALPLPVEPVPFPTDAAGIDPSYNLYVGLDLRGRRWVHFPVLLSG